MLCMCSLEAVMPVWWVRCVRIMSCRYVHMDFPDCDSDCSPFEFGMLVADFLSRITLVHMLLWVT